MGFAGLKNTRHLQIPNRAHLVLWIDPLDYDGQRNTTLTAGNHITAGAIKNKGTAGGFCTLPSGNGPLFLKSSQGIGRLSFDGTDRRVRFALPSAAQPNRLAVLVQRADTTTRVYINGGSLAHNEQIYEGTNAAFLSTGGAGVNMLSTPTGSYNWLSVEFAAGGTSHGDINFEQAQPFGSYPGGGVTGNTDITDVVIGAQFDGTSPMNTEFVGAWGWHSSYPTEDAFAEFLAFFLQGPWISHTVLTPTLSKRFDFGGWPTAKWQVHGGDTVVWIGDSLTQGIGIMSFIPWWDPLATSINGVAVTPITSINKGIGGQTSSDMLARFNTDVLGSGANSCCLETGVNDYGLGVSIDTFVSNLQAMSALWTGSGRAANKMAMCGVLCAGEQFPDQRMRRVKAFSNAMNKVAYDLGHPFFDQRSSQQAYEKANNLPPPGVFTGVLCADSQTGIHPNATGRSLMSSVGFADTVVTG